MEVVHARRAGALVEVVDVLGDDQEVVAQGVLQPREGEVSGVGLDPRQGRAPLVGEDQEAQALAEEQPQKDDEDQLSGETAGPGPPHGSLTCAVKL